MRRAEVRRALRATLKELVASASAAHQHELEDSRGESAVTTRVRQGYVDGVPVRRMVLFMRGTGCAWMATTGGCTFCGFWAAQNLGNRVTDRQHVEQLRRALVEHADDFAESPVVCLYNGGSLLDPREVGIDAVCEMFRLLSAREGCRKVVVESKVTDVIPERIEQLVRAAGPAELSLALGFESANELVRDLCVNKNFKSRRFEETCELLSRWGVGCIPLLIVKPPFLSERQALDDLLATLRYLDGFGLERIDLELPVVKRFTLMSRLWETGLYRPPWIWTVVEALRRAREVGVDTPVFWSPPNIPGEGIDFTHNCPSCTEAVLERVDAYNRVFDVSVFDGLECDCRMDWLAEIDNEDPLTESGLTAQIESALKVMSVRAFPMEGRT